MILVVVPLRLASSRIPRKILADIAGKSLASRTLGAVTAAFQEDRDVRILAAVDDAGVQKLLQKEFPQLEVLVTDPELPSGTDRVFVATQHVLAQESGAREKLQAIVNVQGDMPFVSPQGLRQVVGFLREQHRAGNTHPHWATLAQKWPMDQKLEDAGAVKVLSNRDKKAIYFSRFAIPHSRVAPAADAGPLGDLHIGVYGFNLAGLTQFCAHAPIDLERAESLEQLRALWLGIPIHVLGTEPAAGESYRGIDLPEDLQWAQNWAKKFST